MIKRSCDKCSERLVERDADRTEMKVVRGTATRLKYRSIDLCEPCGESLLAWLADRPVGEPRRREPASLAPAGATP